MHLIVVWNGCQVCNTNKHPKPEQSEEPGLFAMTTDTSRCNLHTPLSRKIIRGACYYLVLTDHCSDLSLLRLVRVKSESGTASKGGNTEMKTVTDTSAKQLCTNDAIELGGKEI